MVSYLACGTFRFFCWDDPWFQDHFIVSSPGESRQERQQLFQPY